MDRKLKIRNSTAEFLTFTIQAQEDGELEEDAVTEYFSATASDGKTDYFSQILID